MSCWSCIHFHHFHCHLLCHRSSASQAILSTSFLNIFQHLFHHLSIMKGHQSHKHFIHCHFHHYFHHHFHHHQGGQRQAKECVRNNREQVRRQQCLKWRQSHPFLSGCMIHLEYDEQLQRDQDSRALIYDLVLSPLDYCKPRQASGKMVFALDNFTSTNVTLCRHGRITSISDTLYCYILGGDNVDG